MNKNTKQLDIPKTRKMSFRLKLILLIEVIAILVSFSLSLLVYREISFLIREISRNKLMAIAATTASIIDPDYHEKIQSEEDRNSEEYQEIKSILQGIVSANPEVDDIYTMRKTEKEKVLVFVSSAYEEEDGNQNGIIEIEEKEVKIGEEFDIAPFPEMQKGFEDPSADYQTNCDKWGCWLSGYAPLLDEEERVIALVGVDIQADDILVFEKKIKIWIILVIGVLLVVLPVILYLILRKIANPISDIIKGIGGLSKNLSSRINLRTGDEFELIANHFNKMAKELEEFYQEMERKVIEKSGELAKKLEEIEERNSKDEALLSSIGDGMIAIDKDKKIIIFNKKAEKIMGISAQAMLGKSCFDIPFEDEKGSSLVEDQRPINFIFKTGKAFHSSQICVRRPDNKSVNLTITASPVMLKNKINGMIAIFRDITEEKNIDKTKTEFISLASHQLRTPLSSINWNIEEVLEENFGKLEEKQKKYLVRAYQSSRNMTELVTALLNVSRIELGTFSIDTQLIRMETIADETLKELEHKIQEKNLKIFKDFDKNLPDFQADPKMLGIIFQNFLSNSVKYTPPGGKITIGIHLAKDNKNKEEKVLFEFIDTGYGIPKDQQSKTFDKLFRADNIKEIEPDGTGLGLYIVKSIVDSSGGKMSFESKENKGTKFFVEFPASGMKGRQGIKKLS